jgi:hypothetical protein
MRCLFVFLFSLIALFMHYSEAASPSAQLEQPSFLDARYQKRSLANGRWVSSIRKTRYNYKFLGSPSRQAISNWDRCWNASCGWIGHGSCGKIERPYPKKFGLRKMGFEAWQEIGSGTPLIRLLPTVGQLTLTYDLFQLLGHPKAVTCLTLSVTVELIINKIRLWKHLFLFIWCN